MQFSAKGELLLLVWHVFIHLRAKTCWGLRFGTFFGVSMNWEDGNMDLFVSHIRICFYLEGLWGLSTGCLRESSVWGFVKTPVAGKSGRVDQEVRADFHTSSKFQWDL